MRRQITAIVVTIAFWTFLALLFTPQTYLINLNSPTPLSVWQAFAANSMLFFAWAALTPLVLWLGGKLPLERPRFWRNLLILFVLSFPAAALQILLVYAANSMFLYWSGEYQSPVPVAALLVGYGATNVMVYWGIIAVSQALNYFTRYRERERSLAEAQLQALKTQINPHFLFNTLNAISELVYENAEDAERTIGKLSSLLRMTLKSEQAQEIPLREELEFLRKYLEIQQTLLQERLKIVWRVEPDTYDACVPNMILQPLVENSVKHGIAPRRGGGTIIVSASRRNASLTLSVEDDGLGMRDKNRRSDEHGGIGLRNTRTRLRHLYGDEQEFELTDRPDPGGIAVKITLPYREMKRIYDEQDTDLDS